MKSKANIQDRIPSEYQNQIFTFITKEHGNLVIDAAAGSGKTWTLCKCIEMLQVDDTVLFAAFNTDITKDIKEKVKGMENVSVMTIHSLGRSILRSNYPDENLEIDDNKYNKYIRENAVKLSSSADVMRLTASKFVKSVTQLVNNGRKFLAETPTDFEEIAIKFGIHLSSDEIQVALDVIEWGAKNLSTIDYTDMLWLPHKLYLDAYKHKYDYIFVDEAQDLSIAQREIIDKCKKINTRVIAAGCEDQIIYAFNGADPESFNEFKSYPNTTVLPLSVSYRCADKIVDFATTYGTIEKNNSHKDGIIEYNSKFSDIEPGSMVLCRNNAPLMEVYTHLTDLGLSCKLLGKEFAEDIVTEIKNTKKKTLNVSLLDDGVFVRLYENLFDMVYNLIDRFGISKDEALHSDAVMSLYDKISTAEILSHGVSTSEGLIKKLKDAYKQKSKKDAGVISLNTIHKSKGLESDNVYIACNSLLPSKTAKKSWEITQERCLQYVAYTRAKDKLSFLDESQFDRFHPGKYDAKMTEIEFQINQVLNKPLHEFKVTELNSSYIATSAKTITPIKPVVKVDISKKEAKTTSIGFSNIMNKKKNKKIKFR